MENSPRSSTTTLSTADSRTFDHPIQPSSRWPPNPKRSSTTTTDDSASDSYFPNFSFNEKGSTRNRKPSLPYVELERREREQEESERQFEQGRRQMQDRRLNERHLNAHSECGRHGDGWLFGGASMTDSVKWLFGKK